MNNDANIVIPHADQYVGVWSILEVYGNSLLKQAQQINIQLHLAHAAGDPEAAAAIQAQASTDLNVTRDGVAIIELRGSLMKQASSFSAGQSMVAVRRQVRAAANDPAVVGILLHIDSPGGTVAGTVDLADDVAAAAKKKTVYAFVDDLCASAAYWIGSQASKMFSNRSAEIGSIGVFMAVIDWSAAAEKEGAKVHVVKFGRFKGAGIAGTEINEEQLAEWQKSVDSFGEMFVDAVASGRKISRSQAEQLADGRCHAASVAVDLKLIDGIQSFDETLAGLVAAAQPKPTQRSKAMSDPTTKVAASLPELEAAMPKASSDFLIAQLKRGATVSEALGAFNTQLAEENEKLRKQAEDDQKKKKEEEEAKAAAAKKDKQQAGRRGNKLAATESVEAEVDASEMNFPQMALDYKTKNKCTWQQACLAIKRKYPEARAAFKGAPLPA